MTRSAFVLALVCACSADPSENVGMRGASLGLFASEADYDYGDMLGELRDRGARDVLIVYRLMQDDVHASSLRIEPSRETLRRTLAQAKALGLGVGLMPIVGLERRVEGDWRGTLEPPDVATWFAEYRAQLRVASAFAEEYAVARLVIGSELNRMESEVDEWRALIAEVRSVYRGALTYSANWDRYDAVPFWSSLDAIAVSAYFEMGSARPSRDQAAERWRRQLRSLHAFADAHERPLLLSEVGYPAHAEAHRVPWDETYEAPVDNRLQADLLGAFCDAYSEQPLDGYYVWNWFGHGGPRAVGYSPRGKPAAAVFERCMRGSP